MPDPHALAALELQLELLAESGLQHLPRARADAGPAKEPAPGGRPPEPPAPQAAARLAEIARCVAACHGCPLAESRRNTVPGEGAPDARVVFVGEAPGAMEDASGRPFVGRAGQLLTRIIQRGMGLRREQVFIANTLKCRPPGNRDPKPEEKQACRPFLDGQLEVIAPDLVIALGRHAGNTLLGRDAPLHALRGRIHPAEGVRPPVLVTYHPSYLLRNPAAKAECWQDIQVGLRHLGLPLPGGGS